MARVTVERDLGACLALVTPHRPRAAALLSVKIARIIGPAFLSATNARSTDDVTSLSGAVAMLFASIPDDTIAPLINDVLSGTTVVIRVDGSDPAKYDLSKPSLIDDAFDGRLSLMTRVIGAALEVNFKDFFDESGGLAGLMGMALAGQPVAPPAAAPSST